MKNTTKLLIGLGIATAATAAIAVGVIRELRAIRNLAIDVDELSDEDLEPNELAFDDEEADALPEEPAVAESADAEITD